MTTLSFISLMVITSHSIALGAPVVTAVVTDETTDGTVLSSNLDLESVLFSRLSQLTCDLCQTAFAQLQSLVKSKAADEDIIKIAVDICVEGKIEDSNVCNSIIPLFKNEFFAVMDNAALKPSEACGVLIENGCGSPYDPRNQNWTVPLPNIPKPPVNPIKPPAASSPKNRILHLSDVHIDLSYTPGLSNDCGEPLCCRPPNAKGQGGTAAGYWGDYVCDTPLWTFEDLLKKLALKSDEFDWVYWTGDIPGHNIWNQSRDDQIYINTFISDLIRKHLPDKPVYPAIGNHESSPVDSFPPPYITGENSNQWLRNALATAWEHWLPEEAIVTLLEGGYYIAPVRKGLKVISLQTNYCNKNNWWLFINATDPGNQLQWLVDQLQAAETAGDKVHLIAHIPPGHGACLETWSYNFHKIVNRYESTIAGQFYGHSHSDEFQIYYDETNTTRPISVAMIGPSVTAIPNYNMGYRIYTIDGDHPESTSGLLDFEVFYMNVSDSRVTNQSNWLLEYVASKDYGMKYGFPSDFDDLVKRFKQDDNLFQSYYRHIGRMNPPDSYCDANCKACTICGILSSRNGDHSLCTDLPDGLTLEDIDAFMINQDHQAC